MKSRTLTLISAISLLAALALPVHLVAQQHRYKLVEIDTLGGPSSYATPAGPGVRILNNADSRRLGGYHNPRPHVFE